MGSRRNFLKGLGASAVGAAGIVAVPEVVERQIVKDVVKYRAVYSDVFILEGDGTKDGDIAMMKIDGVHRNIVRVDGQWGLMFSE